MNHLTNANLGVSDVTVSFGGVLALDHVTLSLDEGVILGLIGPNGAGKTTLMNVISGLQPSQGSVTLNDVDISEWPVHRRARSGVARMFQNVRLFANLTVYENAEAGALNIGATRSSIEDRTYESLDRFGLLSVQWMYAGELDHLQRRKLALARALASKPRFLLLDEPAAGLSEIEADHLHQTLQEIRAVDGCGLLVIDHDMRLIMKMCDSIHVLNHGRSIATGPPESVRQNRGVIAAYLGRAPDSTGIEPDARD